jgi:hypothetical protein
MELNQACGLRPLPIAEVPRAQFVRCLSNSNGGMQKERPSFSRFQLTRQNAKHILLLAVSVVK